MIDSSLASLPQPAPRWVCYDPRFESDVLNPGLATSPWSGHRRFAYDLLAFTKPQVIVELGTHYGCSFFAFIQAVKDFHLATVCYAIDSWVGDEHAGFYGDEVFTLVEETVRRCFPEQTVRLVRKLFDDALDGIPDGSIDILHIDGFHTFGATKHDFEAWQPKLARDGIVLFHDVAPSSGYGSAEYWSELKHEYPYYEFLHHSWGLGILFPAGASWYDRIAGAAPPDWQDLYRYRAENDLLCLQLAAAEAQSRERWDIMQSMEAQLTDTRSALASAEAQSRERWDIMQSAGSTIDKLTCELEQKRRLAGDRKAALSAMVRVFGPEEVLRLTLGRTERTCPFADLALSFYLFTFRLYQAVHAQHVSELFFFSREGIALKEMFDYFQLTGDAKEPVRTCYLEVSRRSTFLPSLGPLEHEAFEILFRQYRRISLASFLASLALEEHKDALATAMGLDVAAFEKVRQDLPTDPLFSRMIGLSEFRALYERERKERSGALWKYVASLTGGELRPQLHIVDVGWKGSIQDNLFNWLTRVRGTDARIHGYYVGLVEPGSAGERNEKEGLLFSNQGAVTPGFHIFNENRTLFEVLLPATHGAPRSYVVADNDKPRVEHEPFVERHMIETNIAPVAREIMARFKHLACALAASPVKDKQLLRVARARHRRLVFYPTDEEVRWMLSITHVENFGVFGESRVSGPSARRSLASRFCFTKRILMQRRLGDVAFWPYLTLRQRALPGVAFLYRWFRRWQALLT